jgi:dolichol-phosphate mannosyltransferase
MMSKNPLQSIESPDEFRINLLWWIIGISIAIRFVFMGILNLLPEEAYYWNYAQHLNIGYLDHPPMVAWLNYLFGSIFGKSEFVVRLPAFLGWLLFAYFMYRFSEDMLGKGIGRPVLILLAILPIYMSIGFMMTPDAPYYVCWAGALYYLKRAIFDDRIAAWYGTGICLGLGLLSKYTMGLILPSVLVFLIIDKNSRRWLKSLHPYVAMIIGFILFSPVLYWNYANDWVSFAFQGTRRWSGGVNFDLHILIASIFVLITPVGVYEVIKIFLRFWRERKSTSDKDTIQYRKNLFMITFALVPLAAFIVHSLQGQPKLNWTGIVWLSVLPLIAARILKIKNESRKVLSLTKPWAITAICLLIIYAGGFGYMIAGMPGLAKGDGMKFPIAWRAYGQRVEAIENQLKTETGHDPLFIGMDKYWLSSEASFYNSAKVENLSNYAGEGLVGGNSLMWNFWMPPNEATGHDGILVGFSRKKLEPEWVTRHFFEVSEIKEEILYNSLGEIGHFYWRAGFDYQP